MKICTIHFLPVLSADRRPSEIANACKSLSLFTNNPIVTAMDNYPVGKAIKERVEIMERRADTDKTGDAAMQRCVEAASVVAEGKVKTDFVAVVDLPSLLAVPLKIAPSLDEAYCAWSPIRLEWQPRGCPGGANTGL